MFNYQKMRNPARFCLALLQIAQDWERLCQERGRCSQPPTLLEPPRVEHQEPQLPKIKKKNWIWKLILPCQMDSNGYPHCARKNFQVLIQTPGAGAAS